MKGKKKDRVKEICKEAFKELIAENKNEVRGLLEEKESLKKYKNGDDYAKNGTIRLKSEGIVKDSFPESMEEYLDMKGLTPIFSGMSKYSKELILLDQLLDIRDIYCQGWKPNWNDEDEIKYVIGFKKGNTHAVFANFVSHEIFAFPLSKTRNNFYNNFRKELEEVKELWS